MALTPEQRALRARLAADPLGHEDARQGTTAARQAFNDRFLREADPEGVLAPAEGERRADSLRRAHFTRLALKSSRARRERATP